MKTKNLSKIISFGLLFLITLIMKNQTMGQHTPEASVIAHTIAAGAVDVTNTGNDIVRYTDNGTQYSMRSIVWDGTDPTFFWEFGSYSGTTFTQIATGSATLSHTDAVDPDVCILQRREQGSMSQDYYLYVIVIYGRSSASSPGVFLDIFSFNANATSPAFSLYSNTNITFNSGQAYRSAANIDSDQTDRFVMTWCETDASGSLYARIGKLDNTGSAFLPIQWASQQVAVPTYSSFCSTSCPSSCIRPILKPDCAIFCAGGSDTDTDIHLAYKINQGAILVQTERFNDLKTGGGTGNEVECIDNSNPSNIIYSNPRIAAHRYQNVSPPDAQTGWTVVYELKDNSNSTYDIEGVTTWFDINTSTLVRYDNLYTDGNHQFQGSSNTLPQINNNNQFNFNPVVTYERRSGTFDPADYNLIIAFTYIANSVRNTFMFYANPEEGIARNGQNVSPAVYNYYDLANPSSVVGDIYPSVSGEQDRFILYSWWDYSAEEINYKSVRSSDHLRIAQFSNLIPHQVLVYPNPVSDEGIFFDMKDHANLKIKMLGASGSILFSASAPAEEIKLLLHAAFASATAGVYMLMVMDEYGKSLFSARIVKQ